MLPDVVEVARLKTGTSPAAKSVSFESVPELRTDAGWKRSMVEALIERYEQWLAIDKD